MASQVQAVGFNNATRRSIVPIGGIAYSPGGISSAQLPQVGFLSKIYLPVSVNVTTSGDGTYSTQSNGVIPDPFRFIKRVRVFTNSNTEIVNLSSAGLYLVNRTLRSHFDPTRNPSAAWINAPNTAAALFNIPSAPVVSSTYNINYVLEIPIALDESMQAGLILLQNSTTRVNLELTFGDASTDLIAPAGGGAVTVNSVAITPAMEFFNVPVNTQDYPNLSMVSILREETVAVNNIGDFQYRPILGNIYVNTLHQFENNAARMVPANFSRLALSYAGTQTPVVLTPVQQLFIQRYQMGGLDLPDGVFYWNYGFGSGLPEVTAPRDFIDTSAITDLQYIYTIAPDVDLTNAILRSVSRQLALVAR